MIKRRDVILISLFTLSQVLTFSLISFGNTVLHVYLNSDCVTINFFGFIAPTFFFADLAITIFYVSFFIEFFFTMLYFIILLVIKIKGGNVENGGR